MLEGNVINLRIIEPNDYELYFEWTNNQRILGDYWFGRQTSRIEIDKRLNERSPDQMTFIIENKEKKRLGFILVFQTLFGRYASLIEIGYLVIPTEQGKGYCTEAVTIILDYLFLLKDVPRIQAVINKKNIGSQRVLEKNGFKKEGIIRKMLFRGGIYVDSVLYSILREEWIEPKILTKI